MMRQIRQLTALELTNLYGWNVFRYTKDPRAKRRYGLLAAVWLLIIAVVCFYVGGLSYGLIALGLGQLVPSYLVVLASLVLLAFGIFKAGGVIFSQKGYDMLCALPVSQTAIVVSRFLRMYVEDLVMTLAVMGPGLVVYGVAAQPGPTFWPMGVVGCLLVPVLPLVISSLAGAVITAISSRMKHKALVQTALSVVLVVTVLFGSMQMGFAGDKLTSEVLVTLAGTVSEMLGRLYPPAIWLGQSMVTGRWGGLLLGGTVFLSAGVLVIWGIARGFRRICDRLFATSAHHDYHMGTLRGSSVLTALWRRELKRYLSSGIYVTNTIIGPILATILAAAVLAVGVDTLQEAVQQMLMSGMPAGASEALAESVQIGAQIGTQAGAQTVAQLGNQGLATGSMLSIDVAGLLPFLLSAVFCMMTTTSVSVSMEGKEFWLVKSLPVSTKMVLGSKILMNLSVMLPFYVVSEILLVLAVGPSLSQLLWQLLIPAVLILFSCIIGITVNLRFYSFDWEREETVVKQSAAAFFGGFAGMLVSLVCAVPVILAPQALAGAVKAVICLVLTGFMWLLCRRNNRIRLESL